MALPLCRCLAVALLILILGSANLGAAPQPGISLVVSFQSGTLVVTNLTKNADAILFGVLQEPHKYWSTQVTDAQRLSADADGTARYTPPSLPLFSIWIAVDLKSGAVAVATPPGSPVQAKQLPAPGLRRDQAGAIAALQSGREAAEVLVVRPNVGAWYVSNGDGGANDDDRIVNGRTTTLPQAMQPIGNSPPAPNRIVPHDIVVIVDPGTMEYFASEVAP